MKHRLRYFMGWLDDQKIKVQRFDSMYNRLPFEFEIDRDVYDVVVFRIPKDKHLVLSSIELMIRDEPVGTPDNI